MCACAFLFLTRFLFDRCNRCQIVTDTSKKKFVWKPFKPPSSLHKWKRFDEASLFNLHHLYFNYHLLMHSNIVQFLEDLDVITALNHSGSFGKNLVKFEKKNENVIYQLRSLRIWKNCALCLEYSFSQYGPPAGE